MPIFQLVSALLHLILAWYARNWSLIVMVFLVWLALGMVVQRWVGKTDPEEDNDAQ